MSSPALTPRTTAIITQWSELEAAYGQTLSMADHKESDQKKELNAALQKKVNVLTATLLTSLNLKTPLSCRFHLVNPLSSLQAMMRTMEGLGASDPSLSWLQQGLESASNLFNRLIQADEVQTDPESENSMQRRTPSDLRAPETTGHFHAIDQADLVGSEDFKYTPPEIHDNHYGSSGLVSNSSSAPLELTAEELAFIYGESTSSQASLQEYKESDL